MLPMSVPNSPDQFPNRARTLPGLNLPGKTHQLHVPRRYGSSSSQKVIATARGESEAYEEYTCKLLSNHIAELKKLREDVASFVRNTKFDLKLIKRRPRVRYSKTANTEGSKTARMERDSITTSRMRSIYNTKPREIDRAVLFDALRMKEGRLMMSHMSYKPDHVIVGGSVKSSPRNSTSRMKIKTMKTLSSFSAVQASISGSTKS